VTGGTDRITHVMRTVEEADEIKVALSVVLRRRGDEVYARPEPGLGRALARDLGRRRVESDSDES